LLNQDNKLSETAKSSIERYQSVFNDHCYITNINHYSKFMLIYNNYY